MLRDRHLTRGRTVCAMISRRPAGQQDLAARACALGQDGPHGQPAFLVALGQAGAVAGQLSCEAG